MMGPAQMLVKWCQTLKDIVSKCKAAPGVGFPMESELLCHMSNSEETRGTQFNDQGLSCQPDLYFSDDFVSGCLRQVSLSL